MTQQEALDILKLGHNVYLTGPAGSGKTFLLNKYIAHLRKNNKNVAVTASTGIAATHLGGITIHSWSGLGIKEEITEKDIKKMLKRPYLMKRLRTASVLIIDELSMLHDFQFDLLNYICQAFKNSFKPFGGMQIVCSGDFFQLPPVQKQGKAKFVTESAAWQDMGIKICYLEEQHRQQDDKLLALLNSIRSNAPEQAKELLFSLEHQDEVCPIVATKLYTHNVDVDAINSRELSKLQEKEFVYRMHLAGVKKIAEVLKKSCLAPERLAVKKGAAVMFVKNNFDQGYVNGTLGKVIGFDQNKMPVVETFAGQQIIATPATWVIEEDGAIKAEIRQLPLRLAWAITVHKSQGMNLDAAEINLSKSFIKGMGYVALSRLRSLAGLKLKGINELAFLVDENALGLDKQLKQSSQRVAADLKKISFLEKKRKQKKFLNSLPFCASAKDGVVKIKEKRKKVSTYEETKIFVLEKLPIKEIAKQRGFTEETILNHLEKLTARKAEVDLEYLRLPKDRFEKIKAAFAQSDDLRLAPARQLLGKDFSYNELRLARLFLPSKSSKT